MPVILKKKKCRNADCATGMFLPRRSDQGFCDQQCKNHYHNKRKKEEAETTFSTEAVLRKNQRVLQKLSVDPNYKAGVPLLILQHEGVDVRIFTEQMVVEKTGRPIRWSHNYGLELIAGSPDQLYKIHKR